MSVSLSKSRTSLPNPYVRRRWRLLAVLVIGAIAAWDVAFGLILGGIELNHWFIHRVPFGRATTLGGVVAVSTALPLTVAVLMTLGSARHADKAVRIASVTLSVATAGIIGFGILASM